VNSWHKTAFKLFWKLKSKPGRPKISLKTIALIKRIHKENPLLSPEKIHDILVNLGVTDAPIAKYIPNIRKAPTDKQRQSWINTHIIAAVFGEYKYQG
jgi:Holliday junction resolvasome RuvABC DNA-binding subunit